MKQTKECLYKHKIKCKKTTKTLRKNESKLYINLDLTWILPTAVVAVSDVDQNSKETNDDDTDKRYEPGHGRHCAPFSLDSSCHISTIHFKYFSSEIGSEIANYYFCYLQFFITINPH